MSEHQTYDAVVVGAGMGGLYGVHRFRSQGLKVLGIESAPEVGGVWYHNAYPGARVDLESHYYCYFFDGDLYRDWRWSERYAAQPEILEYLNHVADRFDIRRHFRFNTSVIGATWDPDADQWAVETSEGDTVRCSFLIMATGQLSKPKDPPFPGLEEFEGECYQASHWPREPVEVDGRRVGVVGTGSSGVQIITALAGRAEQLFVFQRTPNYSVPAWNGPADPALREQVGADIDSSWAQILRSPAGNFIPGPVGKTTDFTPEELQRHLEERWELGGQPMLTLFADQGVDDEANKLVGDFVRAKIRLMIDDPDLAEKLVPDAYPIGVRRLCVDTGYYQSFNRQDVTLVDIREHPIERVTKRGIKTTSEEIDLDVIILALGFNAFTGSLDAANIRNERGQTPSQRWQFGPRTYLGLMTVGFPNLFIVTGPGSPSVLANNNAGNVHHINFAGDLIEYMQRRGYASVAPSAEAEESWTAHAADVAENLIRRRVDNYMVHVNLDGSRVFIPYAGGWQPYVERAQAVVDSRYEGFIFKGEGSADGDR